MSDPAPKSDAPNTPTKDEPKLTPEQARAARLFRLLTEPAPGEEGPDMDDPDYGF